MVPRDIGGEVNLIVSSAPFNDLSHRAGHLTVRIASMRAVALRSNDPTPGFFEKEKGITAFAPE